MTNAAELTLIVLLLLLCAGAGSFASEGGKHLVLDGRVVHATDNAALVLGSVEKDPRNPLMRADRPWEDALDNLYPNLIFDEQAKRFKLWYHTFLWTRETTARLTMPTRSGHPRTVLSLYAESEDGLAWTKPALGLVGYDGSTSNNILVQEAANPGVFKDAHETDPDRRYKMVYDEGPNSGMYARFAADGIHWSAPVEMKGFHRNGDTHNNAFWDERGRRYVMITRLNPGSRMVVRSDSRDFLNWSRPTLALMARGDEGVGRQHYCMTAFPYAGVYLGFLMMYNVATDRTVDCELTWSGDTVTWHRVAPGKAFIPRGPAGSYDAGCVYAQACGPVLRDGRLWIYYGGNKDPHVGKRHSLLCLARLRPDGFAAYAPQDTGRPGVVETEPMRVGGEPLRITADAAGGSVRVAVVGAAGFSLGDCAPIARDVTDAEVRWGERHLADMKGSVVRLRFELRAARLYTFSGLERIPAPEIIPSGRFRFDEPVQITIRNPENAGGAIRYTLDGLDPDSTSPVYKQPLQVTGPLKIKARLFPEGLSAGGPVASAEVRAYAKGQWTAEQRSRAVRHSATFARDAEGFSAVGEIQWHRGPDNQGGFISITREGLQPMAAAPRSGPAAVFVGDLAGRYGGSGLVVRCRLRAAEPDATVSFNLCGLGIAGWSCRPRAVPKGEWTDISATLRHDWTDEEAIRAGWRPDIHAMTWQDTIRHVALARVVANRGQLDLDEFSMESVYE